MSKLLKRLIKEVRFFLQIHLMQSFHLESYFICMAQTRIRVLYFAHQLLRARASNDPSVFIIMVNTRAFSWLKAPTSAFTFKTLLIHYAIRALTPRYLNLKLGPRRNYHEGRAAIRHYAN